MAVADVSGLMDIASTLVQEEIPFKLRCAICNKLAVNAFRLPCCDQSICETCQASLSDTCPVCTHTPVSPDLCKPNKALRTTLKAFLRTKEKKREKDRQSVAPLTPSNVTPADKNIPAEDITPDQNGAKSVAAVYIKAPVSPHPTEHTESKPQEPGPDTPAPETAGESIPQRSVPDSPEATGDQLNGTEAALESTTEDAAVNETPLNGEPVPPPEGTPGDSVTTSMTSNMAGNFPAMGWNGIGMNPFMAGMFNYPNTMGMPMGMDPMASQGMYGMNMTGMGMNTGMNYNGGMYGSLGWDASQQNNNMWQGGQNKFNPNAFANGTGPPYGGAFGGSNMSAYPSHSDYQSGYYGGYGRGGYRGRGRGQFHGSGRGGFGPMQGHFRQGSNSGYPNQNQSIANGLTGTQMDAQGNVQTIEIAPESGETGPDVPGNPDDIPTGTTDQPQGIPTIDSLDNSVPTGPGEPTEDNRPRAASNAPSQRGQSRSQSPTQNPVSRPRSPSVNGTEDDRVSRHGAETKRLDRVDELQSNARQSRSPSHTSSRPSSRRRHHDSDRERDRRTNHRSQRTRRHRSRSRSSSRNGDFRPSGRLEKTAEKEGSNGRTKASSEAPESRDLASQISSTYHSTKDRGSRREDDRSREQDRDLRRRDRDRDRDRRGRDRDSDRERRRDSDRDKDRTSERDRDRPRERDRGRDRDRDRKRSRRDRSPSVTGVDHPQARRVKRGDEDRSRDTNGDSTKRAEPDKDPYTLEREARNKERLEREQQHREKAKSGRRRDGRQDRVVAGRRINYKYEDEL
ncbi:E3 ubiquitin-protein ligase RBBP6 [Penicillium digitatum PHI26]|uniref:E3 ubiquitin-protein ligase RBBP6 n=2 Tax=Penicillium digitatum TaxID=36651 RepID=K9G0A3_PEND2|nr:E3 ubiquitin-protein ligase RBBP6 [Penicillium digitatum Pd1]EKV06641.1 E3 ubiquitin-protein ligase RBBP6 [Penicillium digitatum Pd1]EKV08323.1 E3 ubiquitin-protein ligase RBBP6 [Penicillium digitatum PHI26]